jgi:hypothetical protein
MCGSAERFKRSGDWDLLLSTRIQRSFPGTRSFTCRAMIDHLPTCWERRRFQPPTADGCHNERHAFGQPPGHPGSGPDPLIVLCGCAAGWLGGVVITVVVPIAMFIAGLALVGNGRGGSLKPGVLTPAEYVKRCRRARDRGVKLHPLMIQRARDIDPTF